MIPFTISEVALKALPTLSFQGGADDFVDMDKSDDGLVFSSALDLLQAIDEGQKAKAENTNVSPAAPDAVLHETTADAPVLAAFEPVPTSRLAPAAMLDLSKLETSVGPVELARLSMIADLSVPVTERIRSDVMFAPQTREQVTFAQTILEGRLPLPPPASAPPVNDGFPNVARQADLDLSNFNNSPQTVTSKGGHEMPTPASTAFSATVMHANAHNQTGRIDQSPPAVPLPVAGEEAPWRETADQSKSQHDRDVSDLPKIKVMPPAQAHQPVRATTLDVGVPQRLEADKSGALITVREITPEVISPLESADRTVAAAQPQAPPATVGAETVRQVANQIAAAVSGQQSRATEIALNPEELGRVRLTMTAVDQTITLNITAERPETVDLMRRHIDALAQEFRALGYENIAFSFGGDADDPSGDSQGDTRSGDNMVNADKADNNTIAQQHSQSGVGLDLRL